MTQSSPPDAAVLATLIDAVGGDGARVRTGEPLAPLTTFHVGGAADYLVETRARPKRRSRASARHEPSVFRSPRSAGDRTCS